MTATVPAGCDDALSDPRLPEVRLAALLDAGSVVPIHPPDGSGVQVARGLIDGERVVVYCSDATKMAGALGACGADRIIEAIELAVADERPVIGLWHSGGAKLADGVESMDGVGRMFAAMTKASGRIPQLSVVLGPAAGAAAYGPALTDIVIMAAAGRMFVTGTEVVQTVTGEKIDMESLGGPEAHGTKSGVVHVTTDCEASAYTRTRRITTLLTKPGAIDLDAIGAEYDLRTLLPALARRAYDVKPLLRELLDRHSFEELQAKWAPNIVIGYARLAGRTVGVIANNPLRKGGCLDSLSAEKAARFVRMCDTQGVPLLVVVDVPGYLPGVGQDWGGVVRRGAKLLHAFAEASVARITLVTRKSYGGAYIAMNSRSLGATNVFAWPGGEVAVMSAEAAVGVLHRKKLAATACDDERETLRQQLIEEHTRVAGGVDRALALGVVDEVIDPARTRSRLASAFAAAPCHRGHHTNIPL